MTYVLIVVVWLGSSSSVTMHDFSDKARCEAGAKKLVELVSRNRRANERLVVAASCVEK